MKLTDDKVCKKCTTGSIGDYFHMFWECPPIVKFWKHVVRKLSELLMYDVPLCPRLLLLADDSDEMFSLQQKRILMAALTTSKKAILKGWFESDINLAAVWHSYILDILILERATARYHKARHGQLITGQLPYLSFL